MTATETNSIARRDWYKSPTPDVASMLEADLHNGLAREEAAARLEAVGRNELAAKRPPSFFKRLADQLNNFLVLMLIAASLISLAIGEPVDAVAIMAIVVLNAALGVIQESRAEAALDALKKMASPEADVIRDGRQVRIPSAELVPGDLVLLETGHYVPADLRLVESVNLRINESALTGESVPASKRADVVLDRELPLGDRLNTAYMSTMVAYGRGRGIVVATGMHTEIGLIARMIQSYEEEKTPLQVKLDQLGKALGWSALGICAVIFLAGVVRNVPLLQMFLTAVSLAIAAVPEGLPAVVTICLALGLQRMVRRHALLRRLPAVETLGSATVICSDKTGTLTQNEMTVVQVYLDGRFARVTGAGYEPSGQFLEGDGPLEPKSDPDLITLLRGGLLCNDARLETSGAADDRLRTYRIVGDPTEGALVVLAAKAGFFKLDEEEALPRVGEIPFDSDRKQMTTIHKVNGSYTAFVKGAAEMTLDRSTDYVSGGRELPLTPEKRREILAAHEQMASQALRVLAVAYRALDALPEEPKPDEVEAGLVFVGLVGMIDPPRPEAGKAIAVANGAGIKTVMITGDNPQTAMAIARELNLLTEGRTLVTGDDLQRMSEHELAEFVNVVDVYARVSPEHKVKIVEALREKGHVVAMTGDGVNDAPALKRADIGIAMGITGTDVAKETADMVLTDDNYASIVSAIEEGRVIYSNIRKFVYYLLSCNVGEILIVFLAMIFNWGLPLTAVQLLVLNLVTDGAPALALGLEKGEPDIMKRKPRPPKESIINRRMTWGIAAQSVASAAAVLGAFLIGKYWFGAVEAHARTMAFTTLAVGELVRAYTSRSELDSLFHIGVFSNRAMQLATASSLAIILAIIYVPFLDPVFDTAFLGLREWVVVAPLLLVPSVVAEALKWVWRRQEAPMAPEAARATRSAA